MVARMDCQCPPVLLDLWYLCPILNLGATTSGKSHMVSVCTCALQLNQEFPGYTQTPFPMQLSPC